MSDQPQRHVELTRLEFGVKDMPISKQIKMLELPIPDEVTKILDLQHDLIVMQYKFGMIDRPRYLEQVENFSKSIASMLPGGRLFKLEPVDED